MGELDDEVEAIEAIFPGCTQVLSPRIIALKIKNHEDVTVQLSFSLAYPEEIPSVLQVIANSRTFSDLLYLERNVALILDNVYTPGNVVLFELIGELEQFLDDYMKEHEKTREKGSKDLEQRTEQKTERSNQNYPIGIYRYEEQGSRSQDSDQKSKPQDFTAGWYQSEAIIDRGSTFIAYARETTSVEQARQFLFTLTCDRKISRAAHNMNSWRIQGENGVSYQDCDDDGETAAGLRMLHLLTVCSVVHFFRTIFLPFLLLTIDHGYMERDCGSEPMVRRNSFGTRPIQTYQFCY